jgi:glycolate oxidase subunit GlcD
VADSPLVRDLLRMLGPDGILSEPEDLLVYECDGLALFRATPEAVVLPRSTEQAAGVVRFCAARGVPIVARGAGTGLSGGATPAPGGIVLELARMTRILDVNIEDRMAHVEAGLVNADLTAAVRGRGFFYAPDPSSQFASTIGGNVAENSGGPHGFKYGQTVRHVLGLTVVLNDGSVVRLGGPNAENPGYDLVGVFVGSEGTFGIATEAWLRLTPIPPFVETLLFSFRSLLDGCRAVSEMVAAGVEAAALEMLDDRTIAAIEASVYAAGYPKEVGAVLLVELDGTREEVEAQAREARSIAQRCGALATSEAVEEAERARLWKGRKSAFGAMGRIAPDLYVQDAVVPRSRIAEVLAKIGAIADRHRLRLANVFHAGDGNLHPNLSYDARDADEVRRVLLAGEEMLRACVEAGGSLSGEHGIGLEKRDFMGLLFTEADLEAMGRVRRAFDPQGVFNPGKVLPLRACRERVPAPAEEPVAP